MSRKNGAAAAARAWAGSPSLEPLLRPLAALREDPRNAHLHDERSVEAIAASLARFGQQKPVVVLADGLVVAGNGTLRAARSRLAWTHVAAVETRLEALEAAAYGLADNRTQEFGTWDDAALGAILKDLHEVEFPLEAISFGAKEAERLIASFERAEDHPFGEDPGAGAVQKEIYSRRGEVYELGPHRLLCGDSTVAEDVARLMGDERAALMATDPPYGVALDLVANRSGIEQFAASDAHKLENDGLDGTKLQAFLEAVFRAAMPHLRENAAWYLWHAYLTQGFFAAAAADAAQVLIHRQIIWVKPCFVFGHGDYHWRHELCFYGWRRGHRPPFFGARNQDTIWEAVSPKHVMSGSAEERFDHPTQKPIELFERPIQNHTKPGEVVYEPFAGSGTQVIAAAKHGRVCRAIEIAPEFCDVIRRRWTGYARSAGIDPGPGALEPC